MSQAEGSQPCYTTSE